MFLSAARKAAEVVGFAEAEVPEPVNDSEPMAPDVQPDMKIGLKQVGHVRYHVFNPAVDLAILQEVFGVLKDRVDKHEAFCPECSKVDWVDVDQFEDDEEIRCSDCGYEGEFCQFDEGIIATWSTSSTPAFDVHDRCDYSQRQLLDYYAALEGRDGLDRQGVEDTGLWSFEGKFTNSNQPLYKHCNYDWHTSTADWTTCCGDISGLLKEPTSEED